MLVLSEVQSDNDDVLISFTMTCNYEAVDGMLAFKALLGRNNSLISIEWSCKVELLGQG